MLGLHQLIRLCETKGHIANSAFSSSLHIHPQCMWLGSMAGDLCTLQQSKWKREFKGSSCFNCVWLVKTREYLALSRSIGMLKLSQGSRQPTRPIESWAWILGIASRDVEQECPPPLKFNRDSDWRPESAQEPGSPQRKKRQELEKLKDLLNSLEAYGVSCSGRSLHRLGSCGIWKLRTRTKVGRLVLGKVHSWE